MIKKELFFHEQTPGGKSLGFSAIFVPPSKEGKDEKGNSVCWMATTFCNKHDKVFSKKIARKTLRDRPLQLVRVKDIPYKLAEAYLWANEGGWVEQSDAYKATVSRDYCSLLRHFV